MEILYVSVGFKHITGGCLSGNNFCRDRETGQVVAGTLHSATSKL